MVWTNLTNGDHDLSIVAEDTSRSTTLSMTLTTAY